jgi:tRNA(Ile)-lysidine synthase
VSRQEIEQYAKENKLDYTLDATNLVPDYTRNKIRLQLIPFVRREINVQAVQHIAEAAQKNRNWKEYIEREGKKAFVRITEKRDGNIYIAVDAFLQEDPVMQDEVLRQVFSAFIDGAKDIGQIHYELAKELFRGASGRVCHFPGNLAAAREYGFVRFGGPHLQTDREIYEVCPVPSVHIVNEGTESVRISFHLENRAHLPLEIPQKDYTKWFDYDMIKDGLVLRNPKEGDYFMLNEKGDRKKLSRYYMDKKIPACQRAKQLVLAEGSHVLWAMPGRISAGYKVSEQTKTVLVVTKERDIS